MKTLKKVEIVPVFIDGFMPDFETMEEGKVYISEQYYTAIHKCLCGCGSKTIMPLNDYHGWKLTKNENNKISFTPSIGNYCFPCKSHYIITNNIANFC